MKFPGSFNYSSTDHDDDPIEDYFLIDHDETLNNYRENLKNGRRKTNDTTRISSTNNNTNNNTNTSSKMPTCSSENKSQNHISRRWCYIGHTSKERDSSSNNSNHLSNSNDSSSSSSSSYHRVILEAPFVRMKEIHITPPRLPVKEDPKNIRLAESKKEEGNKLYKQKKYAEALKYYTGAIDLCPKVASYYGNRAACLLMMGKFKQALVDCQTSIKLDPTFVKGYLREAKCHTMLGDISSALRTYDCLRKIEPNNEAFQSDLNDLQTLKKYYDEADRLANRQDYRTALYNIERALSFANECTKFKLIRAEYLALLGRYKEAQDIATDILRFDSINVDALYVRGLTLYYQDNVEKAFVHFQQVLKYSPDHNKAKESYKKAKLLMSTKEQGNNAFKTNNIDQAYEKYTNALKIDPQNFSTNAKLYFNRALVNAKRNKIDEAIEDCTNAIKLDENYIKAYLKRATLYTEKEMFEESVRDYETVYRKEKTPKHKGYLEDAKLALKKSKRKDYYKILGVDKTANDDEIKKAYKKRALIHHPDRHTTASENEKKDQEKKFKDLGEAYAILSDPKKRARYDHGADLDGNNGFDGFDNFDPNTIFQTFFHGGAPSHFQTFSFNQGGSGNYGTGFSFPF